MALTIQDIQAKQFHVRFRGFDIEEVDSFLDQVVEHLSMLVEENKAMTAKLKVVTNDLEILKGQEHSFKSAIISAQQVADQMKKKSLEDADALLERSKDEAQELKDAAHQEISDLETRVDELKSMQGKLEGDLQKVINSYLVKLDTATQSDDPGRPGVHPSSEFDDEQDYSLDQDTESPDLSDLYEKIDLGDEPVSYTPDTEDIGDDEISEAYNDAGLADEAEEPLPDQHARQDDNSNAAVSQSNIPDLDSDIMFTLHDPLDEDEDVDVAIGEENKNTR